MAVPVGVRRNRPGQVASGAASLRAVDLTLSFVPYVVLSEVSTYIHPGAVTAVIGPTGSGKSTLLRTLNRLNDNVAGYRHTGDVLLDGSSIWHPAHSDTAGYVLGRYG
jgi:phosphate transport system ATP-binding protein